ncbi:GNAT family N-acetyltransferase [Rufibacter latericius]|uniref:GNAT family N-acetyltransferase n=1 Tax=Rufibacter latericius TaxID=2487040 RepID=A0A3M9MG54_9BACT|nr:GNAT family N-acetyltransferase [Rufibacter latericius]RNI24532.1 GNAT family N-acetyltransferase [Rufibacter latericius]
MNFREATVSDIAQMQVVRLAVKENVLSDPALVTDAHVEDYITSRGKGWVCEVEGTVVGFAIADLKDHSIWALFVDPAYEKKEIGRKLHDVMLDWYFKQTRETVWLGTSPTTRAEAFYRTAGWQEVGTHGKGEIRFEMAYEEWAQRKALNSAPSLS